MKQSEAAITKRIGDYFKRLKRAGEPIFFTKLHGSHMQRAGLPDWLVVYKSIVFAIEVKRPGGKTTKLQKHTLAEMQRAGAKAKVVHCLEDVVELIEALQ